MGKAYEDCLYQIQLERCLVVLTSKEINTLLQTDTEIFATALKRGKYLKRGQKQKEREQEKFGREQ
ncbi:hypothetical protein [Neobacillus vireti]|uniref:hypothetical protein n=1 Tax=Neobacillus vireti TaxID=220686 RepID=UPI002FFFA9FD